MRSKLAFDGLPGFWFDFSACMKDRGGEQKLNQDASFHDLSFLCVQTNLVMMIGNNSLVAQTSSRQSAGTAGTPNYFRDPAGWKRAIQQTGSWRYAVTCQAIRHFILCHLSLDPNTLCFAQRWR
jgi:hypothetical protein